MDRRVAWGVAAVIVAAAAVWTALPAGREVRPGPTDPQAREAALAPAPGEATRPALATETGRTAGAAPGGDLARERAQGGTGAARAAGLPAAGTPRGTRLAGSGAAAGADEGAGDSPAGDAPPTAKHELWEGPHDLRGRLLDLEGKPVAKARMRIRDAWPWPGAPPRPIVETDAEGRFAFTGLPSDHYQLYADAGSGEVNVAWYLLPGQDPIDLTLKPEKPKTIPAGAAVVRLVGPAGEPVPRAHVRLKSARGFGSYIEATDGTFLREKPPVSVVAYEVFGATTADLRPLPFGPVTWSPQEGEEDVVTLPHGKTIAGVVRGPDGAPVFGAEVSAADPAEQSGSGVYGRTTTGRDGRFEISNLGEGPYRVQAMPLPPYLPSESVNSTVAVDALELRVAAGLDAEITVLDVDEKPVKGAVVGALPPIALNARGGLTVATIGGRGSDGQVTDAQGHAHLSQLHPGVLYTLTAGPVSRKDVAPYRQEKWEPRDTTVHMARAWIVKGTVHRGDGTTGASFLHHRLPNGTWAPWMPTKKDGTFELTFYDPAPWAIAASLSFNSPRGAEQTITDASLPVTLDTPAAPAPSPAK